MDECGLRETGRVGGRAGEAGGGGGGGNVGAGSGGGGDGRGKRKLAVVEQPPVEWYCGPQFAYVVTNLAVSCVWLHRLMCGANATPGDDVVRGTECDHFKIAPPIAALTTPPPSGKRGE
ncbi:unnamed protein product [Hydatigera taeniaeformis]|uniref:Uncharacterized protein n=1 Tax=Hydatigena taeniaeformis TaxID=6205 RepID=A0A0R3X4H9_HYDTA|nr:unnamed protein product [Hydatigera taeniaeformis]